MKRMIALAAALFAATVGAYTVAQYDLAEAGELPMRTTGGKIVAVQVYSPTNGTVTLKSVWSAEVWTNGTAVSYVTNRSWEVAYSNTLTAAVYTNTYTRADFPTPIYSVPLSTNAVVDVDTITTTTRAYKERIVTTNTIVTGSAASNVYSGAPVGDTYIAPFEHLVFEGTAIGGWLRLVLE